MPKKFQITNPKTSLEGFGIYFVAYILVLICFLNFDASLASWRLGVLMLILLASCPGSQFFIKKPINTIGVTEVKHVVSGNALRQY